MLLDLDVLRAQRIMGFSFYWSAFFWDYSIYSYYGIGITEHPKRTDFVLF